ncbi:MAG: hypothetical protein ACLFQB_14790 [Chitinispirillaceae bacterium]
MFFRDSIENDYAGGSAVGMEVLIIDRKGTVHQKNATVPTIRSLNELFRFM